MRLLSGVFLLMFTGLKYTGKNHPVRPYAT